MKLTQNIRSLLWIVAMTMTARGDINAQEKPAQVYTIGEAWAKVEQSNTLLRAHAKETEAAHAAWRQERLWENPELSVSHNINNPVTKRYFETGRDGETDIQISQRIYIASQRRERILRAAEAWRCAEAEEQESVRLLRQELSRTMIEIHALQARNKIIKNQLLSMQQILQAFEQQFSKGNVSLLEITRLRGEVLQLKREQAANLIEHIEWQKNLRLMMGDADEGETIPLIDFSANEVVLKGMYLDDVMKQLDNRPDLVASSHQVKQAWHEVKLQRAEAWPELRLTGEWDKNGNIGHDFFAVGVSMTIPLFDRKQGAIKEAHAKHEARQLQHQWQRQEAEAEWLAAWQKLQTYLQIAQEAKQQIDTQQSSLMQEVQRQYLERNISLIELTDLFESYRENQFLIIDSQRDVLVAMVELNIDIL